MDKKEIIQAVHDVSDLKLTAEDIENSKTDPFGKVYNSLNDRISSIDNIEPKYSAVDFACDEKGVITIPSYPGVNVVYNLRMSGKTIKNINDKLVSWGDENDNLTLTIESKATGKLSKKSLSYIDYEEGHDYKLVLRSTIDGSIYDYVKKTNEEYEYHCNIGVYNLYDFFFDFPSFGVDRKDNVFEYSIDIPDASIANNYIEGDYVYIVNKGDYFDNIDGATTSTLALAKEGSKLYIYSMRTLANIKEALIREKINIHFVLEEEKVYMMTSPILEVFPGINTLYTDSKIFGEFITAISGDVHRLWKNTLDRVYDSEVKLFESASIISYLKKERDELWEYVIGHDPFFEFMTHSIVALTENTNDLRHDIISLVDTIYGDIYRRLLTIENRLGIDSGGTPLPPEVKPRPHIEWEHIEWQQDTNTIYFTTRDIPDGGFSEYDMEGAGLSPNPDIMNSGTGYHQLNWGYVNSIVRVNKSAIPGFSNSLSVQVKIELFDAWWYANVNFKGR